MSEVPPKGFQCERLFCFSWIHDVVTYGSFKVARRWKRLLIWFPTGDGEETQPLLHWRSFSAQVRQFRGFWEGKKHLGTLRFPENNFDAEWIYGILPHILVVVVTLFRTFSWHSHSWHPLSVDRLAASSPPTDLSEAKAHLGVGD